MVVVVVLVVVVVVVAGDVVVVSEVSVVGEEVLIGGAVVVVVVTAAAVEGTVEVAPDGDSGPDPQLTRTGRQKQSRMADMRRRRMFRKGPPESGGAGRSEMAGRQDMAGIGTGIYHITQPVCFRSLV